MAVIFLPKMRSPSQWPGTARSATSAGRSEIITMLRSWPWPPRPSCRPWPAAWPGRCAGTCAALFAVHHGSGRRATGRWSRGTPASPGHRDRSQPTTPRSARGDHRASSLRSTVERRRRHWVSLARFGRSARFWRPVGLERPVLPSTAVGVHLSADRRRRAVQSRGNRPDRETGGQTPGDLLTLFQGETQLRALPRSRSRAAMVGDEHPERDVLSVRGAWRCV